MIIGLLLLFPIAIVYLLICSPIDLFSYLRRKKKYANTLDIIPSLGYIFGIAGPIGAGKSTLLSGIITYLEDYTINLAHKKIEYVQTIINDYDFTKLNECLDEMFYDTKIEKLIKITSPLISAALYVRKLNPETGEYELYNKYYDDGIKKHAYADLIKDYIEAYMSIKRRNYVYSNISYKSIITEEDAFGLDGSDFKLKERLRKKDYTPRRYAVYGYDDVALDPDKINFNWQKAAQSDAGTFEHLRIWRHLFKGTSRYGTTIQNPERLVKAERELYNSIVMVRGKCDIVVFKRIKHILKIINSINELSHNVKLKIKKILHIKINENKSSKYKDFKRFFLKLTDKLDAKDFLEYDVEIYDTAKEAENGSRNSYDTKFVLPKKWCYGPIDTYEFAYQYDAAVQMSELNPRKRIDLYDIQNKIKLTEMTLNIKSVKKEKKEVKTADKNRKVKLGAATVN